MLTSELLDTKETSSKTTVFNKESNSKKEGTSLFDSLLSDAKTSSKESSDNKSNKNDNIKKEISTENKSVKEGSDTQDKSKVDKTKKMVDKLVDIVSKEAKTNTITNQDTLKAKEETKETSKVKISTVETSEKKSESIKSKEVILKEPITKIEKSEPKAKEEIKKDKKVEQLTNIPDLEEDDKEKIKEISKVKISTVETSEKKSESIKSKEVILKEPITKIEKSEPKAKEEITKDIKAEQLTNIPDLEEDDKEETKNIVSPTIKTTLATNLNQDLEENTDDKIISKVVQKESKVEQLTNTPKINDDTEEESDSIIKDTKETEKTTIKENNDIKIIVTDKSQIVEATKNSKEEIKIKEEPKATVAIKAEQSITSNINTLVDNIIETKQEQRNTTTKEIDGSAKQDIAKETKLPLMANMFLSGQKNLKQAISTEQLSNAKKNLEQNKTIAGVKESAKMLDLDAQDVKIDTSSTKIEEHLIPSKTKAVNLNMMKNNLILNTMILEKQANTQQIQKMDSKVAQEKATTANIASNELSSSKEVVSTIQVPVVVVETIQNKIIGAQQKVGTFMSDVAKNMYLNYKPPVTAFKINLNPANLGSISIVMRSNKADNSLSVSMNMSNSNTLDTFSDNKSVLQSALMKNFSDSNSEINISFNMQENNSQNNKEQSGQEKQKNESNQDTVEVENKENEAEDIALDNDYM